MISRRFKRKHTKQLRGEKKKSENYIENGVNKKLDSLTYMPDLMHNHLVDFLTSNKKADNSQIKESIHHKRFDDGENFDISEPAKDKVDNIKSSERGSSSVKDHHQKVYTIKTNKLEVEPTTVPSISKLPDKQLDKINNNIKK